jgi:hypothetical protein
MRKHETVSVEWAKIYGFGSKECLGIEDLSAGLRGSTTESPNA